MKKNIRYLLIFFLLLFSSPFLLILLNNPEKNNNLMFVTDDIPLLKKNVIKTEKDNVLYLSQIVQAYKEYKILKLKDENYKEQLVNKYKLSARSLEIFDNIITLDDQYQINSLFFNNKQDKIFVFCHGILMSIFRENLISEKNHSLYTYFKDDFDVLIPEWPGSSINNYKNDKKNFERMIDVCAEWLKKNYNGKKIIISGHSFGCWLALGLAKKLKDQDITVILNNAFYDNQTAILWTLSPIHDKFFKPVNDKFLKAVTTKEYRNNIVLQDLYDIHEKIFILANPRDMVCPYHDAQKLKLENPRINMLDVLTDSRNFVYKTHTKINFEENFWIAQNVINNNYVLTENDYNAFKKGLVSSNK